MPQSGQGFKSVGFAGTRDSLTDEQQRFVQKTLQSLYGKGFCEFHHSDCIGSDKQAHAIAREIGYTIIIHPSDNDQMRALCMGDYYWPAKPFAQCNRDIISNCQALITTPKVEEEILSTSTWAKIRYARKFDIMVLLKIGVRI